MCRYWDNPSDLGSQVSRSLVQLIKTKPAVGWVKANLLPSQDSLNEILKLKRYIEDLENELSSLRNIAPEGSELLSQGEEKITISFTGRGRDLFNNVININGSPKITWNQLFFQISPLMIDEASEIVLIHTLQKYVQELALVHGKENKLKSSFEFQINRDDFQTIKVQFQALGLIKESTKKRSLKDSGAYWQLTPYRDSVMNKLRAVKRQTPLS